uniref:centromere/kinetochore protein zw10 homolog isoform X1 n=2 Tax=Myxine glutinosa TaxID=7769 RepID=UPI0035902F48
MASLVTEVLALSGRLEKEDLATKIANLTRRMFEVKSDLYKAVDMKYEEFLPTLASAENLEDQFNDLSEEVNDVKQRLYGQVRQEATSAVAEFSELSQQLELADATLITLQQLHQVDHALESSQEALEAAHYVEAVNHLLTGETALSKVQERGGAEISVLRPLHEKLLTQRENVAHHLDVAWASIVIWNLPDKDFEDVSSTPKTELILCRPSMSSGSACPSKGPTTDLHSATLIGLMDRKTKKFDHEEASSSTKTGLSLCVVSPASGSACYSEHPTTDLLHAYALLGLMNKTMKIFASHLLKGLLEPLLHFPELAVDIREAKGSHIFQLVSKDGAQEDQGDEESPGDKVERVFSKLKALLAFVHANVLDVPPPSADWQDNNPGMMLGDALWLPLCDAVIKYCLLPAIPAHSSKLPSYSAVMEATENFEAEVRALGFLTSISSPMLTYARDVSMHFASLRSQFLLVTARSLLETSLHNTTLVPKGPPARLPPLSPLGSKGSEICCLPTEYIKDPLWPSSTPSPFSIPRCTVSSNVIQLLDLARGAVEEATQTSGQCAVQLFHTVRKIFHLYMDIVPMYHRDALSLLPQLSAVHYNNCLFLARHLQTMGHEFMAVLPRTLRNCGLTFVDIVPELTKMGTTCLSAQLKEQQAALLAALSGARGFGNLEEDETFIAAQKAIRQVILQLDRLASVWDGILPVKVFTREISFLLEVVLKEIITQICHLQDISVQEAERLHVVLTELAERIKSILCHMPPLGESDEGVHRTRGAEAEKELSVHFLPSWMRFQELLLLLLASLQLILERWADGKGPLAHEFSAVQVKGLVRALFQNTDRRSATLARIH